MIQVSIKIEFLQVNLKSGHQHSRKYITLEEQVNLAECEKSPFNFHEENNAYYLPKELGMIKIRALEKYLSEYDKPVNVLAIRLSELSWNNQDVKLSFNFPADIYSSYNRHTKEPTYNFLIYKSDYLFLEFHSNKIDTLRSLINDYHHDRLQDYGPIMINVNPDEEPVMRVEELPKTRLIRFWNCIHQLFRGYASNQKRVYD